MIKLGILLTLFVTLPIAVAMAAVIYYKSKRKAERCCWVCRFYDWDGAAVDFVCRCRNSERFGCFTDYSDVCDKWEELL